MSVQTQITRIKGKVASSYQEVQKIGGLLPQVQNLDGLPQTIANINFSTIHVGQTAPDSAFGKDGDIFIVGGK